MSAKELIDLLRSDSCQKCGYIAECTAEKGGCLLHLKAADMLELAATEKQAAFSLGQMDMRQAAQNALLDASSMRHGVSASVYRRAAAIVGDLVIT